MISPETRAEIRRYFYAEHWKVGTIAQQLYCTGPVGQRRGSKSNPLNHAAMFLST